MKIGRSRVWPVLFLICSLALPAHAVGPPEPGPTLTERFAHKLATYVPNRILDLLDIVRLRVRFGPGAAASFRLTRPASVVTGSYSTLYMGLYGPRGEKIFPSPIGFENLEWDSDPRGVRSAGPPYYGPLEIGAGLQLPGPGLDVGVEPLEAIDFLAGLIFLDLRGDDF
jgi:hypothetical protein